MSESEKILFHYTSLEGLMGITSSKSIWATNILYLNDASELNYSIRLFREQVIKFQRAIGNALTPEYWFFETLMDNITTLIPSDRFAFFVCSFSEEKDLLSQWRGYCPKGIGFSLGFKYSKLKAYAKLYGLSIRPCIYDENEQIDKLRKLIQRTSNKFTTEIKKNLEGAWDSVGKQLAADSILEFIKLAPTFKHPKFKEEKEWRIVASLQAKKVPELIKFRSGQSMVVPYIEIFMPMEG